MAIIDELNAAVAKMNTIQARTGATHRAQDLLGALNNLRDEVEQSGLARQEDLSPKEMGEKFRGLHSGRTISQLMGEQELSGDYKYEDLDPGWIECLFEYAKSERVAFPPAPAGGAVYPLRAGAGGEIKIALAGDWGTKNDPAYQVAAQVRAAQPDYTIHLGDIYYAGLPVDENAFLLGIWPKGTSGTFALNSNHEMYCGGAGYFSAIGQLSNRGCSYFALQNQDWLIVGLDSAYFAYHQSFLYEKGYLGQSSDQPEPHGNEQTEWLTRLLAMPEHHGKRLMILTHHDGFDVKAGAATINNLYYVIKGYVGTNRDFYWYWGHVHGGIAYNPIRLENGGQLVARCVGHGGVPYPPYPRLETLGGDGISVAWAERDKATTGDPARAWNGYLIVTLNGPNVTEAFYDENGRQRWPL